MLQILRHVLFYGLLTQSSAQLEAIPGDPADVLSPALSLSPDLILLNSLKKELFKSNIFDILQNLSIVDILKSGRNSSRGLLGRLLPKLTSIIPRLKNLISINVTNPSLLELELEQSPDGHQLFAKIPLGMVLQLKTFLTGELLKLDVKLNIIVNITAMKDKDGKFHLVIENCKNDPGHLKITLLEGTAPPLLQKLVNTVTKILTLYLPHLIQKKVCPLLNRILHSLDVTFVHDIAGPPTKDTRAPVLDLHYVR